MGNSYGWGRVWPRLSARDQVLIASKFGFAIENRAIIGLNRTSGVDSQVSIEDVAGAVKGSIEHGTVGHFGISETSAKALRGAHAVQPIMALQSEYSVWTRDAEGVVGPDVRGARHRTRAVECALHPVNRDVSA